MFVLCKEKITRDVTKNRRHDVLGVRRVLTRIQVRPTSCSRDIVHAIITCRNCQL